MTKPDIQRDAPSPETRTDWYVAAMERLVDVVQELSHARDLPAVMAIVRTAARELTGADGATFVLRDGDRCHYADEDAISPLWKGQKFPMETCISGWAMLNAAPALIEDIYQDPRIPADAYRPTFVKSLAMVPIRTEKPVGAIGNYWAKQHRPTEEELAILQALAHVTSVAMENVDLYARLQDKVAALQRSNAELASFAWAASHDLKTPLRGVDNLASWAVEDLDAGEIEKAKARLRALRERARRMQSLLDGVLDYAKADYETMPRHSDLAGGGALAEAVRALVDVPAGFTLKFGEGFGRLVAPRVAMQRVLCNLIGNAIKHHDRSEGAIAVDALDEGGRFVITVADDGPGVPSEHRERIFELFQTLEPRDAKGGSGMGLSLVRKIVALHGGEVGLDPAPGRGAVFRVVWPKDFAARSDAA